MARSPQTHLTTQPRPIDSTRSEGGATRALSKVSPHSRRGFPGGDRNGQEVPIILAATLAIVPLLAKDNDSVKRLEEASAVFPRSWQRRTKAFRKKLPANAHCIVIVPSVKTATFLVGGNWHGDRRTDRGQVIGSDWPGFREAKRLEIQEAPHGMTRGPRGRTKQSRPAG